VRAIISQRLVKTVDGGRAATCEILRMTGRVRDMILDPEQTGRLGEVITEGEYYGMQTFDQALFAHVKAGRVSVEEAMKAATSPHDFKLLLAAEGRRGTTMDDLGEAEMERDDAPAAGAPGAVAPAPAAPAPAPVAPAPALAEVARPVVPVAAPAHAVPAAPQPAPAHSVPVRGGTRVPLPGASKGPPGRS
jgi:twitching motility protein PilT